MKKVATEIKKAYKLIDNLLREMETGPGGHIPDGSGPPPHGRGQGPGKGKQTCKESVLENKYREFFKAELKAVGKSIPKMSDSEKKLFFKNIKKKWRAKKGKK